MRKIQFLRRKLSQIVHSRPVDTMPPNFTEKTFANSHKPQNLRKFSPSKVSHYTVVIAHSARIYGSKQTEFEGIALRMRFVYYSCIVHSKSP